LLQTWAKPPIGDDDEDFAHGFPLSSDSEPAHLPRELMGMLVLVVDDDEDTAELFAAGLTACGAEVVTANSAPDALRLFAVRIPDVVVTDIAMPGADGYWLVREIRQMANAAAGTVPIVAVTAFPREHIRSRVLASGFFDHLEKPVDPLVLCATVARASRRP